MKPIIIVIFAALLTIAGCTEPANNTNNNIPGGPILKTLYANNITAYSASIAAQITAKGDCSLTSSGVALGTSHNPEVNANSFINLTPADTGTFTVAATGLTPNTKYYARAFATNCKGLNYGNEIIFTTLPIGGGGGTDTGYFNLTIDGVTYVADDLFGPNYGHLYPDGSTHFAYLSLDSTTGELNFAAQSSYMTDNSKSTGFSFGLIYKPFSGTGTYTFDGTNANQGVTIQFRKGTGSLDPIAANYDQFSSSLNEDRHYVNSSCVSTTLTCANNTLQVTQWQAPGGFAVGTFSGTVYENAKAAVNCTTSPTHTYSGNFKLKRLQ